MTDGFIVSGGELMILTLIFFLLVVALNVISDNKLYLWLLDIPPFINWIATYIIFVYGDALRLFVTKIDTYLINNCVKIPLGFIVLAILCLIIVSVFYLKEKFRTI